MAKGQYIGVNGVARKVTTPYVGVNGVARNVTSGYVGVNGVARKFFEPENNKPIVLQVAKQTAKTYVGETAYENEEFILLNIYPKKSSSTVNITYGGLTKTLTFSGTNAQSVYFGTFNGVTDSVATPSSGTLTIEGGCSSFASGEYKKGTKSINIAHCDCITTVIEWGDITSIPDRAFYDCTSLTISELPSGITSIGESAFYRCTNITLSSLPSGVTSIGNSAFYSCTNITLSSLPSGVTSIGNGAFNSCTNITLSSLPSGITSIGNYAFYGCTNITLSSLPSGITSIGESAFAYCTNITISSLPSGVTTISGHTFEECHGITQFVIHDNVTSIGTYAFYFNEATTPRNIVIGAGVTNMEYYAIHFRGRLCFSSVTMMGTTPPQLANFSIYHDGASGQAAGIPNYFAIYVPKGCIDTYRTAWAGIEPADNLRYAIKEMA